MIHEGQTEKECTNACVAIGGKYALYDAANKKAYQLDNQKMPVKFAGQKVKVTGDVDTSTNTIKVTKIEAGCVAEVFAVPARRSLRDALCGLRLSRGSRRLKVAESAKGPLQSGPVGSIPLRGFAR